MNLDNDYDSEGNNIVPCPLCLNVYCPSKEDGKCPYEEEFVKSFDQGGSSISYTPDKHLKDDFPKSGCCGRCENYIEFGVCKNPHCPCHAPSETSAWEERFDDQKEYFLIGDSERDTDVLNEQSLKTFIRATVAEAKREVLRELLDNELVIDVNGKHDNQFDYSRGLGREEAQREYRHIIKMFARSHDINLTNNT